MKCPICGSEMKLTVCEPHICPKCLFAAFPNRVEKLHAIISEKEQAAEKRGAEKIIGALEVSACQTRRFARDVDIMSWGSGFETAIAVAKSALKAYEEGE